MKGKRIAHLAVVSGILLMWLSACATPGADLPSGEVEVGLVEGPQDLVTTTADGRDAGGEAEVGLVETPLDSDSIEAGDVDVQMPSSPPIGTPYQMGDMPFQVGDVIQAGDLVMSVLGWSTSPTSGLSTADPGNVYVMIDLVLINRGGQLLDIHFFPMDLMDENGVMYYLSGHISAFDLSLNPGEQVRGLIPIEVAESSRGLQFLYHPYVDEAEADIVVDLGPEPIALDFPEELYIPETHVHSIGEEISYGEVTVTVLGWRLSQGNENDRPAEGTKLVVVDVLIVNKGSEALKYRPDRLIFLRDTDLNRYEHDSRFWHSPTVVRDTTLVPGEPVRFDVVFQVPEAVNEFYLIYDDGYADDEVNELYVGLPSEPVTAEVPVGASVFGDEIHAIGQEIGHGDLTLVVLGWSNTGGDILRQPEEGNVYVIVDVLMVNRGETINVRARRMKLFDADLRRYWGETTPRYPYWPLQFDDISRGERLRGQVAFEVPSDSSDHIFVVELSSGEEGQVAVSLGAQPATFDPPSKLLAPNPNAFRVGETIKLGDLELLVVSCAESFGRLGVEPKAGYKFLIIEVSLTNLGSKSVDSDSSMYQPQIRDATGYRFEINPFLYLNGQSDYRALQDPIAAGEQVHAFLFYEVPIESSGFVLLFDPKWIVGDDGGDGVSIDLGVE